MRKYILMLIPLLLPFCLYDVNAQVRNTEEQPEEVSPNGQAQQVQNPLPELYIQVNMPTIKEQLTQLSIKDFTREKVTEILISAVTSNYVSSAEFKANDIFKEVVEAILRHRPQQIGKNTDFSSLIEALPQIQEKLFKLTTWGEYLQRRQQIYYQRTHRGEYCQQCQVRNGS